MTPLARLVIGPRIGRPEPPYPGLSPGPT